MSHRCPPPPPTRFGAKAVQPQARVHQPPSRKAVVAPPAICWPSSASAAAQSKAIAGYSARGLSAAPTKFDPAVGQTRQPVTARGGRPAQPVAQPYAAAVSSAARTVWSAAAANPVTAVATVGVTALVLSYGQARYMIATAPAYLRNVSVMTVMFGGHRLVRALFDLFRRHYRYNLRHQRLSWDPLGIAANCVGLSEKFSADLRHFGIRSDPIEVATGDSFLVYCPNFIDNAVPGGVFYNGMRRRNWYLFNSHWAVQYGGWYYDTMAGTVYANFTRDIVLDIVDDRARQREQIVVFRRQSGGVIMDGQDRLVLDRTIEEPGGFPRATLTSAGATYRATTGDVLLA